LKRPPAKVAASTPVDNRARTHWSIPSRQTALALTRWLPKTTTAAASMPRTLPKRSAGAARKGAAECPRDRGPERRIVGFSVTCAPGFRDPSATDWKGSRSDCHPMIASNGRRPAQERPFRRRCW
jgi:hypothetical protein